MTLTKMDENTEIQALHCMFRRLTWASGLSRRSLIVSPPFPMKRPTKSAGIFTSSCHPREAPPVPTSYICKSITTRPQIKDTKPNPRSRRRPRFAVLTMRLLGTTYLKTSVFRDQRRQVATSSPEDLSDHCFRPLLRSRFCSFPAWRSLFGLLHGAFNRC